MVRIEWCIEGVKGHDEWYDISFVELLKAYAEMANKRHGPDTYWVFTSPLTVVK
jgi:hypothetical protein